MIEIYLVTSIAPIPVATMVNREWGGMGQNYLKSLLALGFQAFLILVCVGIYAVLIQTIAATDDISGAIWSCIPKQTKIKKERVFDEAKGKAKTRLSFEKTDKPPNGKLRHNPLSRPAQELNSTVHGKIYEVEKENVGVESGHRVELAGEKAGGMAARAVKGGIRRHKLKPYRAAAAAEKQAVKANADFLYQKALHDNPALAHSNPISRFWQKQRIKKQYAKTLKAGGKAKKTAEATAKAAKKTAQETKRATFFVVRHWKGCLIVGGIAFIVLLLFGGLSSCSLFGGNSGSGLIASSYLSEDADITGAESAYAAMEAELQDMLDNIESEYPGYTPQTPTVADFEQRAKAGEAISVTDLAKAVKAEKREQPQKKPSILKKLDEYKKQAAQQPKDKQKEHKKDLEV